MLEVRIPKQEYYDEDKNEFITVYETIFKMEHSLLSIRDWEAKWNIPFLGRGEKTTEQIYDYLRCMTLEPKVKDWNIYKRLPLKEVERIMEYIRSSMTATTFFDFGSNKPNREVVTADVIYYWMITLNIPIEFQSVHLDQLLTLIRVASVKNAPKKKMSQRDTLKMYAKLNEERRKKYNTKG